MHLTTTHGAQDVNFLTKGGKMRVEAQAEKGMSATIVVDPQAKKTIMIMDAQKMYLEMPQKDPPVAGDPGEGPSADNQDRQARDDCRHRLRGLERGGGQRQARRRLHHPGDHVR